MPSVVVFSSIIARVLPEPHAALLTGMLFGTKQQIPPEFLAQLKATGTMHIIALSGMNITILISVLGTVFFLFGRKASIWLTIFSIVGFVIFVGPSASVVRAAVMGVITLIGLYTGRQRDSIVGLLLAGLGMLNVIPQWMWDTGFQLSFLAATGIILLGEKGSVYAFITLYLTKKWEKLLQSKTAYPRWLRSFLLPLWVDLRTTLAAQVFTLPVMVLQFHQVSLIAPVTNVFVGWMVQPIMVLGLLLVVAGWIWLPLAQVVAVFVWPMLEGFVRVVEWMARVPFGNVKW